MLVCLYMDIKLCGHVSCSSYVFFYVDMSLWLYVSMLLIKILHGTYVVMSPYTYAFEYILFYVDIAMFRYACMFVIHYANMIICGYSDMRVCIYVF